MYFISVFKSFIYFIYFYLFFLSFSFFLYGIRVYWKSFVRSYHRILLGTVIIETQQKARVPHSCVVVLQHGSTDVHVCMCGLIADLNTVYLMWLLFTAATAVTNIVIQGTGVLLFYNVPDGLGRGAVVSIVVSLWIHLLYHAAFTQYCLPTVKLDTCSDDDGGCDDDDNDDDNFISGSQLAKTKNILIATRPSSNKSFINCRIPHVSHAHARAMHPHTDFHRPTHIQTFIRTKNAIFPTFF